MIFTEHFWVLFISVIFSYVLIVSGSCEINVRNATKKNTLILLHILFRHGDRTPSYKMYYPKDPYKDDQYIPYGPGELTNEGKMTQYNLGAYIGKRYSSFLRNEFHPQLIFSLATKVSRTQTSLQCFLAGLYPPNDSLLWNEEIKWQPIAYLAENSPLTSSHNCPAFKVLMAEYKNTTYYQGILNKYKDEMEYISEHAGTTFVDMYQVYKLYNVLKQQEEINYKLPVWTKKVYPQPLADMASENYFHYCGTDKTKMINTGYLMRKIILDTKKKICGSLVPSNRQLFIYSAHQLNVACFLHTLGLYDPPHTPNFGAHVTIEIHRIHNTEYVRVLYQNGLKLSLDVMKLPNCEEYCPFKRFISLYRHILPDNDEWCNMFHNYSN